MFLTTRGAKEATYQPPLEGGRSIFGADEVKWSHVWQLAYVVTTRGAWRPQRKRLLGWIQLANEDSKKSVRRDEWNEDGHLNMADNGYQQKLKVGEWVE